MTSVRLLAIRELFALIRIEVDATVTKPARVQTCDHDPGDGLAPESIFLIDVAGDVDAPYIGGGADLATEDSFTATILCRAGLPGGTAPQLQDRVDEFYQAVRNVVLSNDYGSTLDELADDDGIGVISSTELGSIDGPLVGPTDNGFLGLYRVDVVLTTDEVSP